MRLFRARREARLLMQDIANLLADPQTEVVMADRCVALGAGKDRVSIILFRHRPRCLDVVTVLYRGVDVWLPLLLRLRLRRIVRCVLAEQARAALAR